MKTIDASAVTNAELKHLDDVARHLPSRSDLRAALQDMSDTVKSGHDVVVATENDQVSPAMAAKILGVSRTHLYKVMDSGDLPFANVGRDRRISFADLRDFIAKQDAVRKAAAERLAHPERTRAAALAAYRKTRQS